MKRVFGLVLVLMVMLAAVIAAPQGMRRRGGMGMDGPGFGMPGRMAEELGLTDDQKAEIKKIMEAERSLMQPVREQLQSNREQLQALEKNGEFNEAEVTKLAQEQGNLTAQLIVSRARVQAQISQILTPEQRAKADELKSRAQERFREGGRGRRGPDPKNQ